MFDAKFIKSFHNKYFLDLIWRRRAGIRFGSAEHLSMTLSDMAFYLIEEGVIEEYMQENAVGYSKRESDEIFDKIKDLFEQERLEFANKKNNNITQA